MRQTKENTALVKQHILEAATQEFARRGYDAVNLEEVAQSAGISRGPLYYHFKSKEALYIACVEALIAEEKEVYAQILDENKHVLTLLREDLDYCLSDRRLTPFYSNEKDGAPKVDMFGAYFSWLYQRKTHVLTAAKQRGELREDCDISELLTFLYVYVWGMSIACTKGQACLPFSSRVMNHKTEYFIDMIRQKYCP